MVYLREFNLPNKIIESEIFNNKLNIYNSSYPLGIFSTKNFQNITFEPITCFYGGNGSGKTTLLNVIAQSIGASVKSINNYGEIFSSYVSHCNYDFRKKDVKETKLILSDDVFDFLIDTRSINSKVNRRKEDLGEEWLNYKYSNSGNEEKFGLNDYEELKGLVDARRMTKSQYIRTRLKNNVIIQESNGETALGFWENEIKDHALYIIDEPENSLSSENQLKLKSFIEESARFYDCQFIIATHSPFILSLMGAKVYDLDSVPIKPKSWTKLANVRTYYDFFKEHEKEFEE